MVRMITLFVAVVALAGTASAIEAGASMGGKAKNSYSALMCEQEPQSWFCITNARRENLIKLKREGCTQMECPHGYTYKVDAAKLTCKSLKAPTTMTQHTCDPEKDVETCCDKQMQCYDWTCPYGYEPRPNTEEELCIGPQCQWTDVGTCCDIVEPACHEVIFASTPDDAGSQYPATTKRTCRKMLDREGDHDGEHATTDSFLGWTNSEMDCFKLKTSQRSAMETTRIPSMPGPPAAGKSYGKPAPRPTTRIGNDNVVVDAAARGEEENLCKGFDCEISGQGNAESDNDWQQFLDISWNSFTGECHSCLPEKTVYTDAGEAKIDPAAFRVSRAGQLNSVTGNVNQKTVTDPDTGETVKAYPCKAHRGQVMNQVGGYEKDKYGEIIEQTGQGHTEAGRDASKKEVGEATHANFVADMECVNEPLDETAVNYDHVYDCNCPNGYYILNMRCVKFLKSGYMEGNEYTQGDECLPSYGTKGKTNKKGKAKKVLSMNKYFPCDASKAVCADGTCVDIADVTWDCETGFPCLPGSETCKQMDDCNICGGDGLQCHADDCEKCYKAFKSAGKCSMADDVDLHIKGALQIAKDKMELAKWQCKSGKTQAIRDTQCASMAEGGDAYQGLVDQEAEVEKLMDLINQFVHGMDSSACPRPDCWKRVKNDCGRPDVCLDEYVQLLEGTYDADGEAATQDDIVSYKDVNNDNLDTTQKKKARWVAAAVEKFKQGGCQIGNDSGVTQGNDKTAIEEAETAAEAAKTEAKKTAQPGDNEQLCTGKCPEAGDAEDCAVCCPTGECVDALQAEANRDVRLAAHEEEMVKVREAERKVKLAEDKLTATRLAYTYAIQEFLGADQIKFWGCVAQLSAEAC